MKEEEPMFEYNGYRSRWIYDDEFPLTAPETLVVFDNLKKQKRKQKQKAEDLEKTRTFVEIDKPPPYQHKHGG